MKNVMTIEKRLEELYTKRKELEAEHKRYIADIEHEVSELLKQRSLILEGYDLHKINVAEKILFVHGLEYLGHGDTPNVITAVINDLTTGGKQLNKEYFGCKNYDGFYCQRCDCQYGYVPRHGSIVFEIGYHDPSYSPTDAEIGACVYYLLKLENAKFRKLII